MSSSPLPNEILILISSLLKSVCLTFRRTPFSKPYIFIPSSFSSRTSAILPALSNLANSRFTGAKISGLWREFFAATNDSPTSFSSSACGMSRAESETNTFTLEFANCFLSSAEASFAVKFASAYLAISRSSSGDVKVSPSENAETISLASDLFLRVPFAAIALSSVWRSFFSAAASSASEMSSIPKTCLKFSASASAHLPTGDSALKITVRANLPKSNIPAEPFVIPEPSVSATFA